MKQLESARTYKGKNVRIYFSALKDAEIQGLILACQEELEIRSQEQIKVGE